ncbi:MAG: hypothetical protein P8Y53_11010 [Pseudolabrys sp.]
MIATILPLVGRRLLMTVLILLVVSMLLFFVLHVLPVDPAAMSLPPSCRCNTPSGCRTSCTATSATPSSSAAVCLA